MEETPASPPSPLGPYQSPVYYYYSYDAITPTSTNRDLIRGVEQEDENDHHHRAPYVQDTPPGLVAHRSTDLSNQSSPLTPSDIDRTPTGLDSMTTSPSSPTMAAPMKMFIQRTRPYLSEQMITDLKPDRALTQVRDQQQALMVWTWVWSISDAMGFPSRTRCTAMILYHRVRLYYNEVEYNIIDAAAATLFAATKIEDTLKKSLEILAVAHNLRHSTADPINSDSPLLEAAHARIIGIERQILEACSFDFRNRHHEKFIIKFSTIYSLSRDIAGIAWLIAQDAYKTYTVLKMTPAELSLACLMLAGRLQGRKIGVVRLNLSHGRDNDHDDEGLDRTEVMFEYETWRTTFRQVLECIHDILDLYTDHLTSTLVGPRFGADAFIKVRIELNREAKAEGIPPNNNIIHTHVNGNGTGNGHDAALEGRDGVDKGIQIRGGAVGYAIGERSMNGTVRFMLSRDREKESLAEGDDMDE